MPGLPSDTNVKFQSPTIDALSESLLESSCNDAGLREGAGFCHWKNPHPAFDDSAQSPWARPRQTVPSTIQKLAILNLLFMVLHLLESVDSCGTYLPTSSVAAMQTESSFEQFWNTGQVVQS